MCHSDCYFSSPQGAVLCSESPNAPPLPIRRQKYSWGACCELGPSHMLRPRRGPWLAQRWPPGPRRGDMGDTRWLWPGSPGTQALAPAWPHTCPLLSPVLGWGTDPDAHLSPDLPECRL